VATPGPFLRDFEAYYAAGATWLEHGDPYSAAIWKTEARVPGITAKRYELLPYVGPPFVLSLWAVLGRFGFQDAARVWAGLLIIAALSVVAGTALLLQRRDRWGIFSLLLLAVAFGPLTSDLALGQVAIVAFAAVLVTTLLVQSRYWWGAAVTVLMAAVQPNIALLLLAGLRGRRAIAAVCAGFIAFLALSLGETRGAHGFLHYFSVLHDHLEAERYAVIQVTPTAIAFGFGLPRNICAGSGTAIAAGAIALATYFVFSRGYAGTAKLALLCALLPFAVPFFHEHDLVVVFFPAALCMFATAGSLRALSSVGTLLVAIDWLGIAQRPSGTLQSLLLAAAALSALAINARDESKAALRQAQGDIGPQANGNTVMLSLSKHGVEDNAAIQLVPLIVIPVIVVCGFIAAAHPAPLWPDAMGALPAGVRSLPAAEAWRVELERTGLLRVNTFWAVLRSLSLSGCAILAIVCAKVCRVAHSS